MKVTRIPFSQINQFSKRDKAYVNQDKTLHPFFEHEVSIKAFEKVIQAKSVQKIQRDELVDALLVQYQSLSRHAKVDGHIEILRKQNTFTIVTAHQPSLFTGPLYYIYKIMSTINLCEQLIQHYPNHNFVPVFITGGEDHDFEEVNHLELFNKKVIWESGEKGSVGNMKSESIFPVLQELEAILGDHENAMKLVQILKNAYSKNERYGNGTIEMVHELFKEFGLVVVNMSTVAIKGLFKDFIKKEILEQPSKELVEATQVQLEKLGFKAQAFPRPINFFYLGTQFRERIVFEEGKYKVLHQNIEFDQDEIIQEINKHPERFSPNVIMRPLFQEVVLPNLAYIGGGGELAYWLERKSQFQHFGIPFPMLIRRNSVLWVDKGMSKRMGKIKLTIDDLWLEEEASVKQFVLQNTKESLDLEEETQQINRAFEGIKAKALALDASLEKKVAAEQAKQMNLIKGLEARLVKTAKQKQDTGVKQVRGIHQKLFPKGGLQERKDNFIPFYLQYGAKYFEVLKKELDPLQPGMVVILDDE